MTAKYVCASCGKRRAVITTAERPSLMHVGETYRSEEKTCECGHRSTVGYASQGRLIEAMNDRAKEALL